jgi:23S rRNA U2552 (ribose-2'-O)-methylase RlmE/FtsJ
VTRTSARLNPSSANKTRLLEQDVMDRFDAGMRREDIAEDLGVSADRVRMVLSYMAPKPTDRWDRDAKRSSDLLAAAIRCHHPDQFAGSAA